MSTTSFASRVLHHVLHALVVIVVLLAALLVIVLYTSALAEENLADEVIRLVNDERAKAGVSTVEVAADLIPAANVRAQEASSYFSHTRPDGRNWKTVFSEYNIRSSYRAENLAEGQSTPEGVVRAWMASPSHRKNILNGEFDHIAVGVYEKDGVLYWSQLFIQAKMPASVPEGAEDFVPTGAEVAVGQYAQVMGVDLNVRAAVGTKAEVIAVAAEGSVLVVLEIDNGWAYVQMSDGSEGWTSIKYLTA